MYDFIHFSLAPLGVSQLSLAPVVKHTESIDRTNSSYLNIKGKVRGQHETASASFLEIDPPHSSPAYCRRMSSFKEPVKCRRRLRAVDTK